MPFSRLDGKVTCNVYMWHYHPTCTRSCNATLTSLVTIGDAFLFLPEDSSVSLLSYDIIKTKAFVILTGRSSIVIKKFSNEVGGTIKSCYRNNDTQS